MSDGHILREDKMAIYIVCPKCKMEYSAKNKLCPKCGYIVKRNKTFRVSVSFHGKRIRQTITGSNLQGAKEIEAKLKAEIVSGEYYDRTKTAKKIKYNDFITDKYLPYAREKKSYSREESILRIWINPVIGKKIINDISPLDIEKIKKIMQEKNKSPRTIEYALAVIRHSINKAAEWGLYTGINPATLVKKPKINNKRVRFLKREEAQKLLQELERRSKKVYEIALISLHTGMRQGEIFNLKFGDLDFTNKLIYIRNPKNKEDRIAYMTDEVKKMLSEKSGEQNEYVFKNKNGRKFDHISKTFSRVVNTLGLNDNIISDKDKVVFHTLRHTFASWLAIQGTPIYTISKLLGHKTLAMTQRYSHLSADVTKEAVEKLFNSQQ